MFIADCLWHRVGSGFAPNSEFKPGVDSRWTGRGDIAVQRGYTFVLVLDGRLIGGSCETNVDPFKTNLAATSAQAGSSTLKRAFS